MVFNETVIRAIYQAKVNLFEIIKNNHQYLLNSFAQVIEQCEDAKKTVEPRCIPFIQNIKNQWFQLREEYIDAMSFEYQRLLRYWYPWDVDLGIERTNDQFVEHMFSEKRFQVPWRDMMWFYPKLLEIQSSVIRQFPNEVYKKNG